MTTKEQITNRLRTFIRQDFNNELLFSLFGLLGIIILLLALIIILFINPFVLFTAIPVIIYFLRNLIKKRQLTQVAKRIENGFASLKGYLVNAVELGQYQKDSKEGYSFELIDATVEDTATRLAPLPITKLINRNKTRKSILIFSTIVFLFVIYILLFPNRAKLGYYAALAPDKTPIQLIVLPGNQKVEKGSKVFLKLSIDSPYHFDRGVLLRKNQRGKIIKKTISLKDQSGSIEILADQAFDYSFQVFNKKSATYHIGLLKPLTITSLSLKYLYPGYTKLAPLISQARDVTVLPGTKIEISGSAENQLASGKIFFDDSSFINLSLDGNKFSGNFTAQQERNFEIRLRDISGNPNERERFRLNLMPDELPFVKLFLPGHSIDLPISMKVLLGINSIDDYGLTNLVLHYEKNNINNRISLKNLRSRLEDTTYYYWDLSNIGFMPGEIINYFVAVSDNDVVSGPKSSKSEVYTIRFPTMAEIYAKTSSRTTETRERLEPLADEQEHMGEEIERIEQELKKERKLDWEERKSLENLVSSQKELLDQIEDLKQDVKNALENMFEGLMLDKESIEKLKELETLLSELLPQELKDAIKDLHQALEKQSPDLKKKIEQFKLSQEDLKKALERALELLKNIQEEEKLKALAKKAEELHKAQEDLNTKFNEELSKLARDENKIKQGLESLEKETEALSKEIGDKELAEDLAELLEQMSEMKPSAQAAEAAQSMQQQQKDQAKDQSQKLLKDLESLKNSFNALTKKLKDRRNQEITENLLNSARNLVALSQEQERLEDITNKGQNLSELAGAQKRLEEASRTIAESLAALSKKSIKIPPNLAEDIIRSLLDMEQSANNLQNKNLPNARRMMVQARTGLDAATEKILQTLAQAQQGGGFGGGMEGLLEQLSQLTADQMMLNQEMGGLPIPIPMPGGLSPQQLALVERILSKQRSIRQALEELKQGLGTEPGLTSSLDGVIEEMKQIERDLSEMVVTRELIERQEKTLNRLLDVQRSVRRREFKEKREREIGKDYPTPSNPTLPADLGERKKLLREKLLQALREDYPKDYERLIKLYFESLLNE